jgi:hypothetical protein
MRAFCIFRLTKLLKKLSLNLEGEGEVLNCFNLGWIQELPSQGNCGQGKLLLFNFL